MKIELKQADVERAVTNYVKKLFGDRIAVDTIEYQKRTRGDTSLIVVEVSVDENDKLTTNTRNDRPTPPSKL